MNVVKKRDNVCKCESDISDLYYLKVGYLSVTIAECLNKKYELSKLSAFLKTNYKHFLVVDYNGGFQRCCHIDE